jgi:hypothetical protein
MAKGRKDFVSLFPQTRPKIVVSKRKCRKNKEKKT